MSTLPREDTTLYYDDRGQGLPIIWLQGLGADHTAWSPQLAQFSATYRCLAPDNRGSGRTEPGQECTIRNMAADVQALITEQYADQPVHVVGLSMGAAIAQELATQAPQRIRSLVLVAASTQIEPRQRELLLSWRDMYPRVPVRTFQRQANAWLFSWRFFQQARAIEKVLSYTEQNAVPATWFAAQIDALLAHTPSQRPSDRRIPTLVVTGADDLMTPPRLGQELAATIPESRFVEIPAAGHSANLEQQRIFNDTLHGFFATH